MSLSSSQKLQDERIPALRKIIPLRLDDLWLLSSQGNPVPPEKNDAKGQALKIISENMIVASDCNVQWPFFIRADSFPQC